MTPMSMTDDQKHWLAIRKHAGILRCHRCDRTISPDEQTVSEGWPDGTFGALCGACADGIRTDDVDHYEVLNTETGDSEKLPPPWRW